MDLIEKAIEMRNKPVNFGRELLNKTRRPNKIKEISITDLIKRKVFDSDMIITTWEIRMRIR